MRYKSRPIVIPYALFLIKCIILTDQWSTGLNKHNQQSYNSTQHRQATGNTDYPAHLIVYVNLLMCKKVWFKDQLINYRSCMMPTGKHYRDKQL